MPVLSLIIKLFEIIQSDNKRFDELKNCSSFLLHELGMILNTGLTPIVDLNATASSSVGSAHPTCRGSA